jgi:transposase InsO family protein
VLTNAPVRAYGIPGLGYRLYSDACDEGLAGILQQIQPIKIKDLEGTRTYEVLKKAYESKQPVPKLVVPVLKGGESIPADEWGENFEDTTVHIERVIAYWSRTLKLAERNYSPTEKEALALKEALIKFQAYIEGEENLIAITDHAALTWSKTFQNVNKRLLTWGTVFAAYPYLKVVHRAGRVHSNVDPISRLRRRTPYQTGPTTVGGDTLTIGQSIDDPLRNMFQELSPKFEERLLKILTPDSPTIDHSNSYRTIVQLEHSDHACSRMSYVTSKTFSVLIGMSEGEKQKWRDAYEQDNYFKKNLSLSTPLVEDEEESKSTFTKDRQGFIHFRDWNGNKRLYVPSKLRLGVMRDTHDSITDGAHGGLHKTYNRIATYYFWPRMSKEIKNYVRSCDICQKVKPRRHAPLGLLNSIPIPERPFEVISMDFITELPMTKGGYDNVLVIVDKLTKYAIFIPTTTEIDEVSTAKLFFKHVVTHFGLPRQIITDRDSKWSGNFWEELCKIMGMTRSLTTAYHPQADGQTEIMNQILEIGLRTYIGTDLNEWDKYLDFLALSYNTSPHSATTFTPAFLLYGFDPTTPANASLPVQSPNQINRPNTANKHDSLNENATEMQQEFHMYRSRAQEALKLGQITQQKYYNQGRLHREFNEGDYVLINPHTMRLFRSEPGRGRKLLPKYEGPFEIINKISPVTYRLRLPVSYGMHPVINIAHLEPYNASPAEFDERPTKPMRRPDFNDLPEVEINQILAKKYLKRGKRRVPHYLVRWKGFDQNHDEWISLHGLRNAPDLVKEWERKMKEKP